jgi:hypothetical protein
MQNNRVRLAFTGPEASIIHDAQKAKMNTHPRAPLVKIVRPTKPMPRIPRIAPEPKGFWGFALDTAPVAILVTGAFIGYALATNHVNLDTTNISDLMKEHPYLRVGLGTAGVLGGVFGVFGLKSALPESMPTKVEEITFGGSSACLTLASIFVPPSIFHRPFAEAFLGGATATVAAIGANLIANGRSGMGVFSVGMAAGSAADLIYGTVANKGTPQGVEELIAAAALAVWMGGMYLYAKHELKKELRRS